MNSEETKAAAAVMLAHAEGKVAIWLGVAAAFLLFVAIVKGRES